MNEKKRECPHGGNPLTCPDCNGTSFRRKILDALSERSEVKE